MECTESCSDFKTKSSGFDTLRYAYMKWIKSRDSSDYRDFLDLCEEHLLLPDGVNMEWLRNLTGR